MISISCANEVRAEIPGKTGAGFASEGCGKRPDFREKPDLFRLSYVGTSHGGLLRAGYTAGSVKKKVAPRPAADSTQIVPPWRSTIFLHKAKPIPVPG